VPVSGILFRHGLHEYGIVVIVSIMLH